MSKIEIALLATAVLGIFLLALRGWHNAMKRRAAAEWKKEQERRRQVDSLVRQAARMKIDKMLAKSLSIRSKHWDEQQKNQRQWGQQSAVDPISLNPMMQDWRGCASLSDSSIASSCSSSSSDSGSSSSSDSGCCSD